MAVMSSLRDKTHIILYTLLAAFLALIVFEWGMNFSGKTGKKENQAGTVNGKPIAYSQYDDAYKAVAENFRRSNPGVEVTSEIELGLQEKAWTALVDQTLLEQQFEKFGITLQDQEVVEALNSPTPPMVVRQYFTDPATGGYLIAKNWRVPAVIHTIRSYGFSLKSMFAWNSRKISWSGLFKPLIILPTGSLAI